jgi:predicted TIM-barrel fold metal-dependent hydrolase
VTRSAWLPRCCSLLLLVAPLAQAQLPVDSALATYIARIKAVDSHAHPMRPVAPGAAADTEYDALPLDGIPPFALHARLRLDNVEWREAQQSLYGLRSADTGATFNAAVRGAADAALRQHGVDLPAWILDQAGIDVMLANRIALGPGLAPPRFRWVSFVDALMLPLDTRVEATRSPDTRALYPKEAALLRRFMADLHIAKLPSTLDAYVRSIVTPTLEHQRQGGAVAVKFEAAYLRPLDFDDPDPALARRVYARYAGGGTPTRSEYKALQDYLFRAITREAGRLGMAVQIHVFEGFGGFYSARGSTPHLLEPAFNDSTLRGTKFVIVHGGWPHVAQTQSLLGKANVYADLSMMSLAVEPAQLATVLRHWLEEWPEKVLFGTDAFEGGPEQSWGVVAWFGANSARHALAAALTAMMRDGEISRERAEALARMVMRMNASEVYGLGLQ